MAAGSTTRQASSFSNRSRSSAKAKRENAGEARSSDDGGARVWRSSSITRSLPVFLMSFMRSVTGSSRLPKAIRRPIRWRCRNCGLCRGAPITVKMLLVDGLLLSLVTVRNIPYPMTFWKRKLQEILYCIACPVWVIKETQILPEYGI